MDGWGQTLAAGEARTQRTSLRHTWSFRKCVGRAPTGDGEGQIAASGDVLQVLG